MIFQERLWISTGRTILASLL